MRKQRILGLILALILTGCSVKEGQLVVIEKKAPVDNKAAHGTVSGQFDAIPQKKIVDKNIEVLQKIDSKLVPLSVSPNYDTVFAYEPIKNITADAINRKVVIGNMLQEINLQAVHLKEGTTIHLGKFMTIKDFKFNEEGTMLAFVDGESCVYVYNLRTKELQKMLQGDSFHTYYAVSWSKDSRRLMLNNRIDFDIASRQLIDIPLEIYTPFIKSKFDTNRYIVQMLNNSYDEMIALYNFNTGSYTSLATGFYMDSDHINVIYTKNEMNHLQMVNLKTLESRSIEIGPIYAACIMKSTGDIFYTTLNPNLMSASRYMLIKFNPNTTAKRGVPVSSPTFHISPGEDKLYFTADYSANQFFVNTADLSISAPPVKQDEGDFAMIKNTLLKMFYLDYTFSGSLEDYEAEARKIFTNTYDPVPQEALENKLVDFKRFNLPLPGMQKEAFVPPTITLNTIDIVQDRASVNVGFYYINAIELVKKTDGLWYITGFSTHPHSKEITEVRIAVQNHTGDIKSKNRGEALKYWNSKENNSSLSSQRKIVEDLLSKADNITMEIGEIELWSMSDPHRAENPASASEARVKVIIRDGTSTVKYKLLLHRYPDSPFVIKSWSSDPLSISQLY